jgi:nucleoside-diphosphate-sugar epimerase
MNIFLTGATGYLGGAIAGALAGAGHRVIGLARSADSARRLHAARVCPHRGSLQDADSLAEGARGADAVVHTALDGAAEAPDRVDIQATGALLRALAGSGKALVYTSGLTVLGDTGGIIADEDTPPNPIPFSAWRPGLERTVLAAAAHAVRSIVIRPAWTYGHGGGPVRLLVEDARPDGVARPVGNGRNHWPVVHIDDLAGLYVMATEQAPGGALLHAVGTPAILVADIAAAASHAAGGEGRVRPQPLAQARRQLGPRADALALDQHVSGGRAQRLLGWAPGSPSILEELQQGSYTHSTGPAGPVVPVTSRSSQPRAQGRLCAAHHLCNSSWGDQAMTKGVQC